MHKSGSNLHLILISNEDALFIRTDFQLKRTVSIQMFCFYGLLKLLLSGFALH